MLSHWSVRHKCTLIFERGPYHDLYTTGFSLDHFNKKIEISTPLYEDIIRGEVFTLLTVLSDGRMHGHFAVFCANYQSFLMQCILSNKFDTN